MSRRPPTAILVMGSLSLVFGLVYLLWLVLGQWGEVLDLLTATAGDPQTLALLGRKNLASPGPIFVTLMTFFLELALTGILLWAGVALLQLRPAARWSALFYSFGTILLATVSSILQAFYLTRPGDPVKLVPILAHGFVTLYAIHLGGAMFLPSVAAAYASGPRTAPPGRGDRREGESGP